MAFRLYQTRVMLALLVVLGAVAHSLGCTPNVRTTPESPERPVAERTPVEPLEALPSGASWVLDVSPADLADAPALRAVVEALFPAERLLDFERRTGVDLYRLTRLVVGIYPSGVVALGEGPWPARAVVRAQEVRLTGSTLRPPRSVMRRPQIARNAAAESSQGAPRGTVDEPSGANAHDALATEDAFGWQLEGYLGNDRVFVAEVAANQFAVVSGSGALYAQTASAINASRAVESSTHAEGSKQSGRSTAGSSTAEPSTAESSTAEPSTAGSSTAESSTAEPSTAESSTAEPSTAEPSTPEPSAVVQSVGSASVGGAAAKRATVSQRSVLEGLRRVFLSSPVRLYRTEPFGLGPESGLGLVLAQQRSLALSVRPSGGDRLFCELQLFGRFPTSARENLKTAFDFFARQPAGRLLGIDAALTTLQIELSQDPATATARPPGSAPADQSLVVTVELASQPLVRGLSLLFGGSSVAVP